MTFRLAMVDVCASVNLSNSVHVTRVPYSSDSSVSKSYLSQGHMRYKGIGSPATAQSQQVLLLNTVHTLEANLGPVAYSFMLPSDDITSTTHDKNGLRSQN